MFSRKRRKETDAVQQFLEKEFKEVKDAICGIDGQIKESKEGVQTLERVVSENTASLHKHDMAIEDMLELMQEQGEKEGARERMLQELEQSRDALLDLVACYQDQLFLVLCHVENEDTEASADVSKEAWKNQMRLVKRTNAEQLGKCGIREIGCRGERVDYDLHEVIEAVDTSNSEENLTVAHVYAPGLLYRGCVRKKARVAAYRLCKPSVQ